MVVLAATLVPYVPAASAAPKWDPPGPDRAPGIAVGKLPWTARPTWTAIGREVRGDATVAWPAAGSATIELTTAQPTSPGALPAAPARVRAGGLPVSVAAVPEPDPEVSGRAGAGPLRTVGVRLHDRATAARAGVDGLLLQLHRADAVRRAARAQVAVDYREVAAAFGADWVSRLRLTMLPDCALTTPTAAGCTAGTPLHSTRDFRSGTVTAEAPLAADGSATVLALSSEASGDNGDYSATSLTPASTWEVSPQTGAFAWSYPLRMVPGVGGPEPSLTLSYNSQAIDGRTGGTNGQGSWIGDGWDMWPGFIERTYQTCSEDTDAVGGDDPNNKEKKTGDQCWWRYNATMSLNGQSTELVDAGGGKWKGVADDGSRIELLKDTGFGNGDNDGEYWRVTTMDGTRYYFGRHHGIGGASAGTETNSVWTTQVYGNHPGEPGYKSGDFAGSRQTQAWRWNLDYVEDANGNTMMLFYGKEAGAYGREADTSKRTTYDRGGYLTRIEYGNRKDASSVTYAAARVVFDVLDRCKAGATCYDSGGKPVKPSWPDTPWDLYCDATPCTDKYTPVFFTQKRLAKIRAQIHTGGGGYSDVESWSLRHEYLDAGYPYGEGIPMYLRGLTRTGHVTTAGGSAVSDPEIVFDPGADPFANRVDGPNDGRTALFRWRIRTITTETGAQIVVTFKPTECTRSALPTPHSNTKRCMPQYYSNDGTDPTLDWFHKYVVDFVDVTDNTGASEAQKTYYDYLDPPAWRYEDSELVKEKKRTWGQFRGYGHVKVRQGLASGPQLISEYRFLRGMDGDKQPTGTRNVWVNDSFGGSIEDHEAYSGLTLEETTLDGATGAWVTGSITEPTVPAQTASANSLKAFMVNTAKNRSYSRTVSEPDGVRWTETQTKYNSDNLPYEVDDLGDVTIAADDLCTRTWYARNASNWMLDRVKRTQTVGVSCATSATLPGDLVADSRTTYDEVTNNWDTDLPVRGLPVKTEEVERFSGSTPVWLTTSITGYDANGRTTSATDARGHTTGTSYTPTLTGPVTSTTVINPKQQSVTTTFAPAWHLPIRTMDANDAITDLAYDGLGRLKQVWQPGRTKGTDLPNIEFDYLVRNSKPTAVTTRRLLPTGTGFKTSVTLFDGWLRERQTQTQAPGGGRALTDTFYDSRGLTWWKAHTYYDISGAPVSTDLVGTTGQPVVPALTEYRYDGAGRVTSEILKEQGIGGTIKWRTDTSYTGDLTTVMPPDGGTRTATLVDGRGRTVEFREFSTASSYDATRYTYTDAGELATVTDAAGNVWKYSYDLRGNKIRDEDPDKGVTATEYDAAGNITRVTDARNTSLVTTYDELGRRTSLREDSAIGPVRAEWVYDTLANGVGKLTRSVRHDNGQQYVSEVLGYDSAGRATGTTVTIPSSEGALCASTATNACSYTFRTAYKPDGQTASTILPGIRNDLAAEQLLFNYNDVGAPTTISSNLGILVYAVTYNKIGELVERQFGALGKRVQINYTINDITGRLDRTKVSPENKPVPAQFDYTYDAFGNLTKIVDSPYGQNADTQCYRYDHVRRLTDAWTPSSGDCQASPDADTLGGPAPYWHSYEYAGAEGLTGSRTKETWHAADGDTVRTYQYPAQAVAAGSRPHALRQVSTDKPGTGTDTLDTYAYDAAGNTTVRNLAGVEQTLDWDTEGRLTAVTRSGKTVSYLYDADGNRLIRRDPNGTGTVLYLPGGMEVKVAAGASTASCTRYYSHVDQQIAVRTKAGGTIWVVADHHGTAEVNLNAADLTVQRRRTLPFGEVRGDPPTVWAGDKGFVGGTIDPTGLTNLGAREYDPSTGRFVSVDPVIDTNDPQQMHGYAYANNAPPTMLDPDGLWPKFLKQAAGAVGNAADKATNAVANASQNVGEFAVSAAKETYQSVKEDPLKFACEVAVGIAVTAAVASVCATGVGCVILAGAAAGAAAAGSAYGVDVAQGEREFSPKDLATEMVVGGAVGAATAGLDVGVDKLGRKFAGNLGFIDDACQVPHSFPPYTRVLVPGGESRAIADLEPGDTVATTDPETGEDSAELVVATYVNTDYDLTDVTVTDVEGDTEVIETTGQHPFWDETDQAWVAAADLRVGHRLRTAHGEAVVVAEVDNRLGERQMHDLTVQHVHTYYVLAGDDPVLVHNCGGKHRGKGYSDQPTGYEPRHGRELRSHGSPSLATRLLPPWARAAIYGAGEGALETYEKSLLAKALGLLPSNHWSRQAAEYSSRAYYGARNAKKSYRDAGGGYAGHRKPQPYRGKHRHTPQHRSQYNPNQATGI
ncbi:polymorphic toxin-type HINT domain-containing protein [Micromonospora sp. NPDC047620]|uniref:polymorphic toxin-type HINT domain-containing protein n=1 Tax=Micromonospora sp. NPDC047620 TaxID=3364251 RepID=UPI0037118483